MHIREAGGKFTNKSRILEEAKGKIYIAKIEEYNILKKTHTMSRYEIRNTKDFLNREIELGSYIILIEKGNIMGTDIRTGRPSDIVMKIESFLEVKNELKKFYRQGETSLDFKEYLTIKIDPYCFYCHSPIRSENAKHIYREIGLGQSKIIKTLSVHDECAKKFYCKEIDDTELVSKSL